MTFEQFILLASLIGGTIVGTFEITWKISESIHDKKKR